MAKKLFKFRSPNILNMKGPVDLKCLKPLHLLHVIQFIRWKFRTLVYNLNAMFNYQHDIPCVCEGDNYQSFNVPKNSESYHCSFIIMYTVIWAFKIWVRWNCYTMHYAQLLIATYYDQILSRATLILWFQSMS